MARKPAILELIGGKSTRQRVWEAIRRLADAAPDESFTVEGLSRKARVDSDAVRHLAKGLAAAGYLERTCRDTPRGSDRYRLIRDNGVEAPRVRADGSEITQGRGSEALWAAMTALDSFTADFVSEIARVKPSTARSYCAHLARAGYLTALVPGKGHGRGGTPSVWCVAGEHRDKPRAPMITRLKAVYDPNEHRLVWCEGADDALEAIDAGEVVG